MTITTILRQLFAAYPNSQATPETIAVYVRILSDIPPADLQTVVDQAVATNKFLPTIAELRDAYHSLQHADRPTWADGWDAVQKEIRRIGSYSTPKFDDPITAKVVEAMGWKTLCAALTENVATDRAQFRQMYEGYASRQERDEKLLPQARQLAERSSANGGLVSIRHLLGAVGK
jgi:hypothetical protein